MTLGEIIKQYRAEHDMSMREFEKISGISRGYLSMLEKNEHPKTKKPITPSVDIIRQVSLAINVPFDRIFDLMEGEAVSIATKENFQLSPLEKEIILRFRQLSNGERDMILRSLGVEEKGDAERMA
ncbi:MAG: helix-turn-helix transcriptional regulator [Blautia producta]|uniref:helix-turn-helix transcriptional regulator n=1 Tax=Blautia producta TaxID=33035 RepID=UPI00290F1BEF|nr:helix-turn-helix transcriptional regulator [Blautia producta]MDU5381411.1 helix-turn-helix transcriptional regulator [Blautia producta]MDU6882484.1 helix-turn-helix transcriptional regulator [Blautia producta]